MFKLILILIIMFTNTITTNNTKSFKASKHKHFTTFNQNVDCKLVSNLMCN
ncbi:hypothetical protein C7H62_0148 [Mesoflavibacter sp. HG96]|nr:hypothetical protein C7H62_0148 [Mesoflavibacter sp. HG96]QIJ90686.1 hypothetical protein C7H56_0148 [Mesoflavibacter sp. HG37]